MSEYQPQDTITNEQGDVVVPDEPDALGWTVDTNIDLAYHSAPEPDVDATWDQEFETLERRGLTPAAIRLIIGPAPSVRRRVQQEQQVDTEAFWKGIQMVIDTGHDLALKNIAAIPDESKRKQALTEYIASLRAKKNRDSRFV